MDAIFYILYTLAGNMPAVNTEAGIYLIWNIWTETAGSEGSSDLMRRNTQIHIEVPHGSWYVTYEEIKILENAKWRRR